MVRFAWEYTSVVKEDAQESGGRQAGDILRREEHRWSCRSKYRSKVFCSSLLAFPSEMMYPKAELKRRWEKEQHHLIGILTIAHKI